MNGLQATGQLTVDGTLPQVLIHAGYVLTACAFLLRDILWLRSLAILANLSVGVAAFMRAPDPAWDIIAWAAAFAAINLIHSCWLVWERHLARFTEAESELYRAAFPTLDTVAVRKLMRRGEWKDFGADTCIARQGVHLDRLILIAEGEAVVLLGGRIIARLGPGEFVGEIAFLTGEQATASVIAVTGLHCLVWRCDELRKRLDRHNELRNTIHAAIGLDMAEKTASHNLQISQL